MTCIEQLEESIKWYGSELDAGKDYPNIETLERAARAHLEAIKQKPYGYFANWEDGTPDLSFLHPKLPFPTLHHKGYFPVYTAPVPQEKTVVKAPRYQSETSVIRENVMCGMAYNSAIDAIIKANPHITFEVQE